jgi:hypothetical protein
MVNNTYEARVIERIEGKTRVTFENRRHDVKLCGKGQPLPKPVEKSGLHLDLLKLKSLAYRMSKAGVPRSEITVEALIHPAKVEWYRKDQVKRFRDYLDKMYHW